MKKRILLVSLFLLIGFFLITLRLLYLMVLEHQDLTKKAERQHQKTITLEPRRGTIYDRNGRELAISIDLESLYGVPPEIEKVSLVAAKLSTVLGVEQSFIEKRLEAPRKFIWLYRKLDPQRVEMIKELNIKEIGFVTESKRFYPKMSIAAHLLGFVGMDNNGLEGIELTYESDIKGEKGWLIIERDALGKEIFPSKANYRPPSPGYNLYLTVDEVIQYITEKELDKGMARWNAKAASAIVMNPNTGEILAMAVRPDFNPNIFERYSPSEWRNRAITDTYEPGSIFKVILAAASLEEGIAKPQDLFDCSQGSIEVGGRLIHDVHRNGVLSFGEVIQKSSNVGAVRLGIRLGKERFYKYIKAFGFGEKTGIDLSGEVSGKVSQPYDWSGTSIGAISIGHEVSVTPLQLLRAFSVIANKGVLLRPYVVSEIRDHEGRLIKTFHPVVERRVISETTSKTLTEILRTVVEEGGTGTKAAIKGNLVAGKTGTAQKIDPATGRYSSERHVSSFVGFLPADDPKVSIIVVIDEPEGAYYGGSVAAPIFKEIAEEVLIYLKIPVDGNANTLLLSDGS